jgi:hypothetical protein
MCETFITPAESIIRPIPSAFTVNAPYIDHKTTENNKTNIAINAIQLTGVVIGNIVSNFSGERSLSNAS